MISFSGRDRIDKEPEASGHGSVTTTSSVLQIDGTLHTIRADALFQQMELIIGLAMIFRRGALAQVCTHLPRYFTH